MPPKKKPVIDYSNGLEELSYETRLEMAQTAYVHSNGKLSIRTAAKQHGIPQWERLRDRINGMKPKKVEAALRQRLNETEERIIEQHILQLEVWGWPPMTSQLQRMARGLLVARGDLDDIGPNWSQRFLRRHSYLKSRFVAPLGDRVVSENAEQVARYFELYQTTKDRHNIHDDDIYNMDEKGFMLGVLANLNVICSRKHKRTRTTQQGMMEWVSLIECISSDGRILSPYVILKAKNLLKDWQNEFQKDGGGTCAVSDRGWTDNELCMEWLKDVFEPETSKAKKGEYRMLLFDGYGSHATCEVVSFCLEKKIVPLCLPCHSTPILQPCDEGAFRPLADAYRAILNQKTKLEAGYSIDKMMFLETLRQARREALNKHNITKSWEKTGLFPFNPQNIIGSLPTVILRRGKKAAKA